MSGLERQKRNQQPVQNKMDDAAESAGKSFAPPTFQLKTADSGAADVAQRQEAPEVSETVTEEVGEHLSLREGFRRKVYLDSRGLPTVGTGHLLVGSQKTKYPVGTTVPDEILEQWRSQDSTKAYDAARQMAAEIDYESQDLVNGLTAVNFQLGTAWNDEHRNTWRHLENQNWVSAAHEVADSNWFKQTPVRVLDFQRVLLNIAGQPTDHESLRTFNAADITKRGVAFPGEQSFNAFEVGGHSAPGTEGGNSAEGGAATETATPTTVTAAPKAEEAAPAVAGLSGNVGLDKDGTTYIGSKEDIRNVQQQLINAGMLPAEVMGRSGKMISNADGFLGAKTIAAIHAFQKQIMGYSKTDGRVDAGGKTWGKLAAFSGVTEAKEEPVSGGNTTPESEVVPEDTPERVEEKPVNANQTDENDSEGGVTDVVGPTTAAATATFEDVPASYADQMKIRSAVGNGGSNSVADLSSIRNLLQLCGYKTDLLRPSGNARTDAKKQMIQTSNCIFHFQQMHGDLSTDARVDPNGRTWKAMVTKAFQNSGGQAMDSEQRGALNETRKGSAGDVPSDINANITNGHLLGIDNSGYLLPEEFRPGARVLKGALEEIQKAIGGFEISCGYRSPEHNVKIGSNATKSQHVQGIAADIQSNGTYGPSGIRTKIRELIKAGKIPAGGIGYYSWGIHYDVRGKQTEW